MKKSGAIVCKKAQHFNERHKGCITHLKGQNCLFAFGFFFNSMPPEALFFLVVSENVAASSASFLQAVLASVGVREQLVASSAGQ
jgi:hypothetical protein